MLVLVLDDQLNRTSPMSKIRVLKFGVCDMRGRSHLNKRKNQAFIVQKSAPCSYGSPTLLHLLTYAYTTNSLKGTKPPGKKKSKRLPVNEVIRG
jgi:hypothetical protein